MIRSTMSSPPHFARARSGRGPGRVVLEGTLFLRTPLAASVTCSTVSLPDCLLLAKLPPGKSPAEPFCSSYVYCSRRLSGWCKGSIKRLSFCACLSPLPSSHLSFLCLCYPVVPTIITTTTTTPSFSNKQNNNHQNGVHRFRYRGRCRQ